MPVNLPLILCMFAAWALGWLANQVFPKRPGTWLSLVVLVALWLWPGTPFNLIHLFSVRPPTPESKQVALMFSLPFSLSFAGLHYLAWQGRNNADERFASLRARSFWSAAMLISIFLTFWTSWMLILVAGIALWLLI